MQRRLKWRKRGWFPLVFFQLSVLTAGGGGSAAMYCDSGYTVDRSFLGQYDLFVRAIGSTSKRGATGHQQQHKAVLFTAREVVSMFYNGMQTILVDPRLVFLFVCLCREGGGG
jgi:hypothetical protein